jgi:hypothetical protein
MTNPSDAKLAERNLSLPGPESKRGAPIPIKKIVNQEKGRAVAAAVPAANAFPQATRLPLQPIFHAACVTVGTSIFVLFVTLCASSISAVKYESERQEDRKGNRIYKTEIRISCFPAFLIHSSEFMNPLPRADFSCTQRRLMRTGDDD